VRGGLSGSLGAPDSPGGRAGGLLAMVAQRAEWAERGIAGGACVAREFGLEVVARRWRDLYHGLLRVPR